MTTWGLKIHIHIYIYIGIKIHIHIYIYVCILSEKVSRLVWDGPRVHRTDQFEHGSFISDFGMKNPGVHWEIAPGMPPFVHVWG